MICACCGSRDENAVVIRKPNVKLFYCGNCGNLIKEEPIVKESEFYRKLEPFEFK